jgi:murein DD-endopeptidase MepM/ murein hydrolase activator NlpD
MTSLVTSLYGTKRVYNRQKKSQHLGIDYRAAIGDQVPATNAGKIVYAGDLFYTGWTVIIDHGLDIFSVYGHLSKTLVKEGQFVVRGELIGLSGNTGRTSGPHLHWGVKVQGQYVDGFVLIDETKKVFQE